MFRANDGHNQQALLDSTTWMDPRIREKLAMSWAPFFYEHVFRKIDEEPFAILYGTTGKPNFPVNILLSLEYIKHMKDCSDLEILDAYNFDYLVNYAVGNRTLGELNLGERTIYNFRERVYKYCIDNPDKDDILFGQFIKLTRGFAAIAGISFSEQRTDTTQFMSNIKKAGRLSLAYDVLVKATNAIPEIERTEELAKVLDKKFKTDVLYRSKAQEADGKLAALLNLCQEALNILEANAILHESEAARITRRFLSEQAEIDKETGKLVPRSNKEISAGSLQSAYDEDATYRKKGNTGQSGYTLELSETCGKDNPFQLLTDHAVKPNIVNDADILKDRLGKINTNTGCDDMYVDGAFHAESVHQAADENNIEIHLTNMTGTEPSKKLPATVFEIDEETNIIIKCPAGYEPTRASVSKGQSCAHFPHEACANCKFREQCYSKELAKDCVVRINLKTIKAGRERETMKAEQKENTSKRAGIEGSNSSMKRKGQGKLRVRGIHKCKVVSGLKAAAQNIKRFIKYLRGGYKPKKQICPQCG